MTTMTTMTTKWIPEATGFPGTYANLSDTSGQGKIHDSSNLQPSTRNVYESRQFDTEEECKAWCDANPVPVFVPVGHGFYTTMIGDDEP